MAKDEQTNQLNLTVVALVALVAIVGLVALVMSASSLKTTSLASGSQLAAANDENAAGQGFRRFIGPAINDTNNTGITVLPRDVPADGSGGSVSNCHWQCYPGTVCNPCSGSGCTRACSYNSCATRRWVC